MSPVLALPLYWFVHIALLSTQGNISAQKHADRGLQLAKAGNLSVAEFELCRAIDLAPRNPTYLGSLGTILAMESKLIESTEYLSKALEIAPHDLTIRRNLAANFWHLHRLEEARQNLELILKQSPGDEQATLLFEVPSSCDGGESRDSRTISLQTFQNSHRSSKSCQWG